MTTIITKRHPYKFYTLLTFLNLFFIGISIVILFDAIDKFQNDALVIKSYFPALLSLFFFLLPFFVIHSHLRNSPKITVTEDLITIGSEIFTLKAIKDIRLTGKMPFKYIVTTPMEGMSILFNDGTEKFLFDDMYSNISSIKLFLEQVVLNKQVFHPLHIEKVSKHAIEHENEEPFKGNQFTSIRGIFLWGIICFFIYMLFFFWQNPPEELLIYLGVFGAFWFVYHSYKMHYFGLTENHLVVRNHNFIWKVNIYHLTDIREIVIDMPSKQPTHLRVITKDYKSKIYPAGTLRDKHWLALKRSLASKGLMVRNECIYEKK